MAVRPLTLGLALQIGLLSSCGLFGEEDGLPLTFEYTITRPGYPPLMRVGVNADFLVYNVGVDLYALSVFVGDSLEFFQFLPPSNVPSPGTYVAAQGTLGGSTIVSVTSWHSGVAGYPLYSDQSFVQVDSVTATRLVGAFHLVYQDQQGTFFGAIHGRFAAHPNQCQKRLNPDGTLQGCNVLADHPGHPLHPDHLLDAHVEQARSNRRLELAKRGPAGSLEPASRAALCSSNAGR